MVCFMGGPFVLSLEKFFSPRRLPMSMTSPFDQIPGRDRLDRALPNQAWSRFVAGILEKKRHPPKYILTEEDERRVRTKLENIDLGFGSFRSKEGRSSRIGGARESKEESYAAEAAVATLLTQSFAKGLPILLDASPASDYDDLFQSVDIVFPQERSGQEAVSVMGIDVSTNMPSLAEKTESTVQRVIRQRTEGRPARVVYVPPEWEYELITQDTSHGPGPIRSTASPLVAFFPKSLFSAQLSGSDLRTAQELLAIQLALQADDLVHLQARLLGMNRVLSAPQSTSDLAKWARVRIYDGDLQESEDVTAQTMLSYADLYENIVAELLDRPNKELYDMVLGSDPRKDNDPAWRHLFGTCRHNASLTELADGTRELTRSFRQKTEDDMLWDQ